MAFAAKRPIDNVPERGGGTHAPRVGFARGLLECLAVALLYLAGALLGHQVAIPPASISPIWPPSGIALAAVLLRGTRVWPGVWLGEVLSFTLGAYFKADLSATPQYLLVTAGAATGAALQALLGAMLVRRFSGSDNPFERAGTALRFMFLGAMLTCLVSSTIGTLSLSLSGVLRSHGWAGTWLTWWVGDTVGVLAVTPFLLVWSHWPSRHPLRRWLASGLLIGLVLVASVGVFGTPLTTHSPQMSLAFLMLPLVVWVTLRLGLHGATLAVLLVVVVADIGTAQGLGPFASPSAARSLLILQVFVGVLCGTSLALAGALTERRRAERLAGESERRWHNLFEHAPVPIWEEDFSAIGQRFAELRAAGVRDLGAYLEEHPEETVQLARLVRILEVSRSAKALLGVNSRSEAAAHVHGFIERQTLDVFAAKLQALWRGVTAWDAPVQLHMPSGEQRVLDLRLSVLPGCEQTLSRILVSTLDVTERQEAERVLREAHRQKDEFIAVLSHELRNPLSPIQNGLFVLERAPGTERAERALAMIKRQVRHLTRLIDDLLDVTRVMRGKVRLRRERLDLGQTIARAIEDLRESVTVEHGLRIEVELGDELLWVEGDPVRLVQVVGNLVNNAAKFTPAGGSIRVELRRSEGMAELRLRDTGIGIPGEMLERIFEPFTQVHQALDRPFGGLGLGLALVKGLVELHEGSITARSEGAGKGSEFTVRLPLEAGQGARPEELPPEREQAGDAVSP